MKLFVVRHGETDDNAAGILCGQSIDNPLNKLGESQAKETTQVLKNHKFDAIYSSPLTRSKQTAEIIAAEIKQEVIFDDRLKERDYGTLAGKTWEQNFGNEADKMRRADIDQQFNYHAYGGESAEEVWQRIESFLVDLRGKNYKSVLIVAHGGVLKSLKKNLHGKAFDEAPKNSSINEFEI